MYTCLTACIDMHLHDERDALCTLMDILFDSVDKFKATLITVTHDHDMLRGFDRTIDFKNFQEI